MNTLTEGSFSVRAEGSTNHGFITENNNDLDEYELKTPTFKLSWKNLGLSISPSSRLPWKRNNETRQILKSMNGSISAGSMTALMGPSGAGKSTLLNCIAKKLTEGVTGDIVVTASSSNLRKLKGSFRIGFVPQHEYLFTQFTVRETLLFASRLNNDGFSERDHDSKVNEVLLSLDLSHEADSKLSNLSGGQLKRASIGGELISNPKILILDEPTSGLDSNNSEKVVTVLKNLTFSYGCDCTSPAIVATIHQPSTDVFFLFDSIYLLSRYGTNLYHGSPEGVSSFLESFGFPRKINVNPADYMIEIANGRYGFDAFDSMTDATRKGVVVRNIAREDEDGTKFRDKQTQTTILKRENGYFKERYDPESSIPLTSLKNQRSTSFLKQFTLLFLRSLTADVFKAPTTVAKMIMGVLVAALMCGVTMNPVGEESGCWNSFVNLSVVNDSMKDSSLNSSDIESQAIKQTLFDALYNESFEVDAIKKMGVITQLIMFYFMLLIYNSFIYGMAGVMTFPIEVKIISKEMSNSWYTVTAYFLAKATCDTILLALCILPMVVYVYLVSEMPWDYVRRPLLLFFFCYTCGFLWESRAQLFSIIFNQNSQVAVILTVGCLFPMFFFSGMYVKYDDMTEWLKPISFMSDLKFSFEGVLMTMYDDRCNGGHAVDFFFTRVLREKSLYRILSKLWWTLNVTTQDGNYVSQLLRLKEGYLEKLLGAMDEFFGPYQHNQEEINQREASFMLSFFNLDTDNLVWCAGFMLLICLISKTAVFIALKIFTRVSRL
jgi:ABC-type multidrug transport system ATPase subunit